MSDAAGQFRAGPGRADGHRHRPGPAQPGAGARPGGRHAGRRTSRAAPCDPVRRAHARCTRPGTSSSATACTTCPSRAARRSSACCRTPTCCATRRRARRRCSRASSTSEAATSWTATRPTSRAWSARWSTPGSTSRASRASCRGSTTRWCTRLLRLAEADLGAPPCDYAWIVFGAEGRYEQLLITDQDNALVYAEDSPGARDYFTRLAARVVEDLVAAGFPPCPAATWPRAGTRRWTPGSTRFADWIHEPTGQALLDSATFFDGRHVHGALDTGHLRPRPSWRAQGQGAFLALMANEALRFRPPIGAFGHLRDADRLDLKRDGLAPIVGLGARAGDRRRRAPALDAGAAGRGGRARPDQRRGRGDPAGGAPLPARRCGCGTSSRRCARAASRRRP